MARRNPKKHAMEDVEELVSCEHFDDPDSLTDQLVENLQLNAEEAIHDGMYDSAIRAIEEIRYVQRCYKSLNKYAQRLMDERREGDDSNG